MVLNLGFSCSEQFSVFAVPSFTFCKLSSVATAVAVAKKILMLLHILSKQFSHFLLEKAHIFLRLPFTTVVPIETLLVALDIPSHI